MLCISVIQYPTRQHRQMIKTRTIYEKEQNKIDISVKGTIFNQFSIDNRNLKRGELLLLEFLTLQSFSANLIPISPPLKYMGSDENPWGNVRPLKWMRYQETDQVARERVVETAVIVDKEYVDQWRKDFPTSRGTFADISLWITDSLNWVSEIILDHYSIHFECDNV